MDVNVSSPKESAGIGILTASMGGYHFRERDRKLQSMKVQIQTESVQAGRASTLTH
jgi:hypothetical protein